MECTKTILQAYKDLNKIIAGIDQSVVDICFGAINSRESCYKLTVRILNIIERKRKLIELRDKIDVVFSLLSDEEIELYRFKYLGIMPKKQLTYSLRTFFRKERELFFKLDRYIGYIGITDEAFFETFAKDRFINSCKIRANDEKGRYNHMNSITKYFYKERKAL